MVEEHRTNVYLPYALWLAENDSFEEAQADIAGVAALKEKDEQIELLQVLTISPNFSVPATQSSNYTEFLLRAMIRLAKKFGKLNMQMTCEFMVISQLLDGQV